MTYLLAYLIFSLCFAEFTLYKDRKAGNKTTPRQYINLVFFWPLVLYVYYRTRNKQK